MPDPIPTYLHSPFVVGRTYIVLKDFDALRDRFTAGETMIYCDTAYSRYDGYQGYFFTDCRTGWTRAWDIRDHEDIAIWRTLFAAQD